VVNDLITKWKEALVAQFEVLSPQLLEELRENTKDIKIADLRNIT
jgi:hypothetical protein